MKGYKHLIYIVLEKMVMSNEILNYIIYIGIFNYFLFDKKKSIYLYHVKICLHNICNVNIYHIYTIKPMK